MYKRQAEERGDLNALCGLFQRAVSLLPEGDPERLIALSALVYPLNMAGRSDEAIAAAAELLVSTDARFHAYGLLAENLNDAYSGRFDAEYAQANAIAARKIFGDLEDELGLAWAEFAEVVLGWMSCHVAAAVATSLRAQEHAQAAGDAVLATSMRRWAVRTMTFGPAPVDEAMRAAQALLKEEIGLVGRADARSNVGMLMAMRGDIEGAREQARLGIESTREAGQVVEAAARAMLIAFVEIRAGSSPAAEDALRRGVDELDRLGNRNYRGTTALLLADALASKGAYEEAARWCAEVRETLNEDDLTDAIAVDSLEGFLAAAAGSHAEGERLSDRAVELASTTDMYDQKGRTYEWHAKTLALAGKTQEASKAAATAVEIYEAKGDIPATAWARELLDSLSG